MKSLVLRSLFAVLVSVTTVTAVSAQVTPSSPGNTGNLLNYPSGTRIYQGGAIATPSGTVVLPNVTMPGANGSNTYYYPDGSHVTIDGKTVSPAGTFLNSNSPNGGLRNPTVRPAQPLPPGTLPNGSKQP